MKVYGQLESAQPENLSSDPSVTPWGRFYFHSSLFVLKLWNSVGWVFLPGRRVIGSRASPTAVVLATGVVVPADGADFVMFLKGPASGGTITANPAIAAGTWVGQKLTIKTRSDTDYLLIPDALGTSQNGDWYGGADSAIVYTWDGTNWSEDHRR